jgi:hypothetical protein
MIIDIHSHYIPLQSQKLAAEIDKRHKLMLAQNEPGTDVVLRDGKPYLRPLNAEFYDLELRAAIMEQQGVDMQTLSAAEHVVMGSDFPYDMGDPKPVESVQKTNIGSGAKRQIISKNACKLLGLGS